MSRFVICHIYGACLLSFVLCHEEGMCPGVGRSSIINKECNTWYNTISVSVSPWWNANMVTFSMFSDQIWIAFLFITFFNFITYILEIGCEQLELLCCTSSLFYKLCFSSELSANFSLNSLLSKICSLLFFNVSLY